MTKNDIPDYLQDSELYKNIDSNDLYHILQYLIIK